MTNLLDLICSAIAQMEGWNDPSGTTIPQRYNNPGDLRAAPWLSSPVVEDGYWKAASPAVGIAGLYHQVALNIARGYTLRQLVEHWAPGSDGNDPESYLAHVQKWAGIQEVDTPLWTLLDLEKPT